jgi:hypothetical protein
VEHVSGPDLYFDPNDVDRTLVVECWISHGRRADDPTFDPGVGDVLAISDDEAPVERARVVRRDGNRVWMQILLPSCA